MARLSTAVKKTMLASCAGAVLMAQAHAGSSGMSAWNRVVMEATFTRADANGDGYLTKDEAARLSDVSEQFDALDADRNGTLDLEEFAAGFAVPA